MRDRDLADALGWSVLSALVLLLLPIGHVSPDGLGQSVIFSAGFSRWNPNHLLVEPLGSWWMGLTEPGSRAESVDHLRRLSILAGSLAAGLLRFGVARRLTSTRLAANHATAWLAFSSAFARLWVLDEAYMVQMPAVVGVSWLTLRYLSGARALYGSACSLVDLAPLVTMFRDLLDLNLWPAGAFLAGTLALSSALLLCLRGRSEPGNRSALLLAGVWAAAVLGFGIHWNNSDDQFYVQLAVAFAALASRLPLKSKTALLGMLALLWNVVDVASRRVFYPRQERLAMIERELGEAGLIIYPGFDEMDVLLALEPVAPAVSLTHYSVRHPAKEGLEDLFFTIFGVLREGRPVAVVDIVDVAPTRPPWKFLKRMGYDQARVVDTLDSFALERVPKRVGPFSVRWIRAPE